MANTGIQIIVEQGDVTTVDADVLALKHAQNLYGADATVAARLKGAGVDLRGALPPPGQHRLVSSRNAIPAKQVLFIGVPELRRFNYQTVRDFGRQTLMALHDDLPTVRHLAMTIHGIHLGLDESESFEAELAGLRDAITEEKFPSGLERITFVELNASRVQRLKAQLAELLPKGLFAIPGRPGGGAPRQESADRWESVGTLSASKPHVFVAMPFVEEMDDVFHYGIKNAVNAAGFLCERADYSIFSGDILHWIKERIASAKFVIADLTGANPNVYLEVGYAWALRLPTILLVRDPAELLFDVRGQRCIVYKKIKELEERLAAAISSLGLA